jgi:peptidoglycan/xylan/chitin deacetylase (PgdA/CDA1 family)
MLPYKVAVWRQFSHQQMCAFLRDWPVNRLRMNVIKAGLTAFTAFGGQYILAPLARGEGVIFTLHHVKPSSTNPFQPNRILEIQPDFLRLVVHRARRAGYEFIPIGEVPERLANPKSRPFAVLTFDDGYRDNLQHAYPVLKEMECPFTIYVATSMPDGSAKLWWRVLEAIINKTDELNFVVDGQPQQVASATRDEKYSAYEQVYWWLRHKADTERCSIIRELAVRYGVDIAAITNFAALSWDEIQVLAQDSIVTIGAHTVSHPNLARLDARAAQAEMANSVDILASYLDKAPRHFAYPFGDPTSAAQREFGMAADLGFETGVTTRPGVLYREHANHLTALPRISLNGDFQARRYLDAFLSGVPSLLFNKMRRLNVA